MRNPPDWIDDIRASLKGGIRSISAPSLFPTPPDLARRVVELAGIESGNHVLEPSAGTGALLDAIRETACAGSVVAIELNAALADSLRQRFDDERTRGVWTILGYDFLEYQPEAVTFDRIVMNPPFDRGADIRHIRHAFKMLAPGGRLVSICANGPRQQAAFHEIAAEWIELPAGTFDGTNVRSAIVVLDEGADRCES